MDATLLKPLTLADSYVLCFGRKPSIQCAREGCEATYQRPQDAEGYTTLDYAISGPEETQWATAQGPHGMVALCPEHGREQMLSILRLLSPEV